MDHKPAAAPNRLWAVRGLNWEYDDRQPRFRRWGVSDGCRGVGNYANPLTAYVALRRWRKVPARPS